MKTSTKVLIVSFFLFLIVFLLGKDSYFTSRKSKLGADIRPEVTDDNTALDKNKDEGQIEDENQAKEEEIEPYNSLAQAIEEDQRKNILILGMEDVRSDTMLLASLCKNKKKLDIISIPRDTYIHRKGYDRGEERKINSVYYDHGIKGVKRTVSYILQEIPIHHYIMLDYEGVKAIVDSMGGVDVDVPFHMKYDDKYSNPPLHIDIPKGQVRLDGQMAIEFLRYRKGNDKGGGYIDGDLGRIRAQQEFLKSLAKKAKNRALSLIPKTFKYVKTDIGLFQALSYGKTFVQIDWKDIGFKMLAGKGDFKKVKGQVFSYYIYDKEGINQMLKEIYNVSQE